MMAFEPHLTEEEVEAFSANKLRGEAATRAETHFFTCESCQNRVQLTDEIRSFFEQMRRAETAHKEVFQGIR